MKRDDDAHRIDWTGRFVWSNAEVARPRGIEELRRGLSDAARRGLAITPQGGNTGLVGGSVGPGLIVSIARPHWPKRFELDAATGRLVADAAMTLAELDNDLHGSGWRLPVDLASRDRATLGGMASTNAGGALAYRFGPVRAHVEGLELVTADGRLLSSLHGNVKWSVGPRVLDLALGAEGTLGIVTALGLRLTRRHDVRVTVAVGVGHVDDAVAVAQRLWSASSVANELERAEWVDGRVAAAVMRGRADSAWPRATRAPAMAIFEFARPAEEVERTDDDDRLISRVAGGFGGATAGLDVRSVEVAPSNDLARRWWLLRELAPEAIAALATRYRESPDESAANRAPSPMKFDVAVPPAGTGAFVDEARRLVEDVGATPWMFGHLGDGNVHLNVTRSSRSDPAEMSELSERVWRLVDRRGGAPSAEHGIGRDKIREAEAFLGTETLRLLRTARRAFDPDGRMNPGVLLAEAP